MIIDLDSFERELPINIDIPPDEIDLENESVKLLRGLSFEGKAVKGSASTVVSGRLSGNSEVPCDRCLEPIERLVDIEFEDEFIASDQLPSDKERELAVEDLTANEFDGKQIDLMEVVREQILLDMPQQAFCKEDCKGLCQKCGANLNLIDCKCETEEFDPRWAALKNLN